MKIPVIKKLAEAYSLADLRAAEEALYNEVFHKSPIKAMCEDNNGNIWLGAGGLGGIAKITVNQLDSSLSNSKQKKWVFDYLNTNKKFQKQPFYRIKKLLSDSKGNICDAT